MKNLDKIRETKRKSYHKNKEKYKERIKEYRKKNREKRTKYNQEWKAKNPERAKKIEIEWNKKNPEKVKAKYKKQNQKRIASGINAANVAKRRAALLQRTPSWADLEAIKKFYQNCPKGMTVDHIIPLQGTKISGLHVLENLQYLTPYENDSKNNKYSDK